MTFVPCLIRSSTASGEARFVLGDSLVDRYLEFVAGRSRPNTLRAVAFDLKTFFSVVDKDPARLRAVPERARKCRSALPASAQAVLFGVRVRWGLGAELVCFVADAPSVELGAMRIMPYLSPLDTGVAPMQQCQPARRLRGGTSVHPSGARRKVVS